MKKLRVLLADDYQTVLAGIGRLLESDFTVLGTVSSGPALIETTIRLQPDVVVTEVFLPLMDGIESTRQIRARCPDVKVVLLTMHADPGLATQARAAGVSAYVLKRDSPDVLIRAIRDAALGREFAWSVSGVPAKTLSFLRPETRGVRVTPRQRDVMELVARGCTMQQIAEALRISRKTVEYHKTALKQQLGVRTTAELVATAVRYGMAKR